MMRKEFSFVLALLLLTTSAFAVFSTNIETTADKSNEIYTDEIAKFKLTVENLESFNDRYAVGLGLDPTWIVYTEPSLIEVSPGESETVNLFIDPTSQITKSGKYSLNVDVKSMMTGETVRKSQEILIKSEAHRTFLPAVTVVANVGEDGVIDPREGVPVRLLLKNQNSLDLKDIRVEISGPSIETDTYSTSLEPNGEVTKFREYDVDPYIAPQNETLKIQLRYDGKLIADKRIEYEVQENRLFFSRNSELTEKFLYDQYDVTLTNLGNVLSKETFTYEIGFFENLFTKTEPESKRVDDQLEFEVQLEPSESIEIVIETDYRIAFYTILTALILALLFSLGYYTFRSPVTLTKQAVVVGEKDEATSEVKILVNVKNRTSKAVENINLVDRIPGITEIEKEFSVGTLKPKKIVRHPKKGTLIKWEFPSMDAFEERIITYRIHSKLGILGDLTLPQAVVRFNTPSGNKRLYKSNSLEGKDI